MGRNRSDWTDLEGRIADVITMGAADWYTLNLNYPHLTY